MTKNDELEPLGDDSHSWREVEVRPATEMEIAVEYKNYKDGGGEPIPVLDKLVEKVGIFVTNHS